MRARIGTAFSGRRIAEVEHHCRDRQGDVHRQRLAAYLARATRAIARARRAGRSRRARPRARESVPPVDRPGDEPDGRSPAPSARIGSSCTASARIAPRGPPPSSRRAHSSDVPSTTDPAPRIPAATAPWRIRVGGERHPGGDVGRHHPVLGDRDEQQVEEEALLLVGSSPVSSRWKYSVNVSLPMRSPVRSRPRTSTRSG